MRLVLYVIFPNNSLKGMLCKPYAMQIITNFLDDTFLLFRVRNVWINPPFYNRWRCVISDFFNTNYYVS